MERWKGKIALVTGGSVGIGKALVEKLSYHGLQVVACARNIDQLQAVADGLNIKALGKVYPYQCDLSKEEEILGMFGFIKEKFGTLHVCVNNAGLAKNTHILDGKTEDWRQVFDVNVIGLSVCVRESVHLMRSSGVDDGHVINLGSVVSHAVGDKPLYAGTKFAIRALTEGLRIELRALKSHIRATLICPGLVKTEFACRAYGNEAGNRIYTENPVIDGSDIADAIIYALAAPSHVDVNDIIVTPTQQMSVNFGR